MNPSLSSLARSADGSPWLPLDIFLFRLIGAGRGPAWGLGLARWVARWSWLPLLALAGLAWWPLQHAAGIALLSLVWTGLVQWGGKRLARHWNAPRPFKLGLCANHLGHGGRAGFPSSHALAMGCLLGTLLPFAPGAFLFTAMAALALATGWARVHGGAHFPLDVLVGLALGLACGLGIGAALVAWLA